MRAQSIIEQSKTHSWAEDNACEFGLLYKKKTHTLMAMECGLFAFDAILPREDKWHIK